MCENIREPPPPWEVGVMWSTNEMNPAGQRLHFSFANELVFWILVEPNFTTYRRWTTLNCKNSQIDLNIMGF